MPSHPVAEAARGADLAWVDPRRIVLATQGINSRLRPESFRTELLEPRTSAVGGDWDEGGWGTVIRRFEDMDVYRAMRHRFLEGGRWEDTRFFARVVAQIEGGQPRWRCRTREEFLHRLEHDIEGLHDSIARDGFRTQDELGGEDLRDEIRVGIRRNGRLLLFDGRHRLSVARVLGLERVPVSMIVRHTEWLEFKQELVDYADKRLRGKLYQQLDHPDLESLPAKHGTERIGVIRAALGPGARAGQRLLDIGTHWGYMCQQLELLGYSCVGIETGADAARIARRLAVATESRYEIWKGDLLDYPAARFDVVLALSIFHHMIKTEERHERLIAFLGRVETDVMLFEAHDPVLSAQQMEGAYRNYGPDEFAAFVARHAGLPNVEFLGRTADRYQRPLYKLTR